MIFPNHHYYYYYIIIIIIIIIIIYNHYYLHAIYIWIFYQLESMKKKRKKKKKEHVLNKEFSSLCQWFIDNKLPTHFVKKKTLFSKSKGLKEINISFAVIVSSNTIQQSTLVANLTLN